MRAPRILIVGTMDTKADEMAAVADEVVALGGRPIVIDSSVGGSSPQHRLVPDYGPSEVAATSGAELKEVWRLPRGEAVGAMRTGVTGIVRRLGDGEIDGAICIGGAGAHLAGPAFQSLPLRVPKLIVTPLASGQRQFEPYVGISNVAVMHSVIDIAGLNRLAETIYRQAAGYIVGAAVAMLKGPLAASTRPAGLVAGSMNGNTTPAVDAIRRSLKAKNLDLVAFHANGVGGRAMEEMIAAGEFVAVVDMTTTELAGAEFGGLMDPGPDRMTAAGRLGIPQVLVPGCLDLITVGRLSEAQRDYPGHALFVHNPELTLVRMKAEQMAQLAKVFAAKANAAVGPTAVCVPKGGFSIPGISGGPFFDPEADGLFLSTLRDLLAGHVRLQVVEAHINDEEFARVVLEELEAAMNRAASETTQTKPRSEVQK